MAKPDSFAAGPPGGRHADGPRQLGPANRPRQTKLSLKRPTPNGPFRFCRSCYGHIAGQVGVAIARSVRISGYIQVGGANGRSAITPKGREWLASIGLAASHGHRHKAIYATGCMDWSEREPHLAGPLGVMLLKHFVQLGWVKTIPESRQLALTEAGLVALSRQFGLGE